MRSSRVNSSSQLILAAFAAFCTYFCMYAFRKPFTAGTFEGQEMLGVSLKTIFVISPFIFMVVCGVGLYIPYVAFHTTVFERIVAASRHPANLVFLMYVADAMGYLGYALVIGVKTAFPTPGLMLPFFRITLCVVATGSILALLVSLVYFYGKLRAAPEATEP